MIVFSTNEYITRVKRTQKHMVEKGIDLLLTTSPENINYLSGYSGWSFYTPQVMLLAVDADEPVLVLRGLDVGCAEFTSYLKPSNVIGYPETYVDTPDTHPMSFIANTIKERGWDKLKLGIEMDAFFLTPTAFVTLQEALPRAQFTDAGLLINWARLIKSKTEIELLCQSGTIASQAMKVAINAIKPGIRECDVAAQVYATQIAGTKDFGGSVPCGLVISAGDKTRAPHLSWTDNRFKHNQAINLELGGSRFQYHCGLARSIYLGTPPASLERLAATVIDGLNHALDSIRPGVLCEDVAMAWNKTIAKAGYKKDSRIGYSIGLGFQPMWIDGTASLRTGDKTEIKPNMVFHVICGMWHGEDNFVISETIHVTESASTRLTNIDQKLFIHSC